MGTRAAHRPLTLKRLLLGVAFAGTVALALGGVVGLGGCETEEPVGHTKTTTKRTVDTPTEKTTVTETHEKDTRVYPR